MRRVTMEPTMPDELFDCAASLNADQSRLVPMRLQRFLSRAGVASRRGAENLMTAGRVRVNGHVVSELGSKVDPRTDVVEVDGVRCCLAASHTYLMLYKPRGYLTTMSDPQGRPCVAQLVPLSRHPGLFPVGRLDEDTTGLLLFTTDGDLAQGLLHPSFHVEKRYVALVRGILTHAQLKALRTGVDLGDGISAPAEASLLGVDDPTGKPVAPEGVPYGHCIVSLTIHEGKKHQVKRMLSAVGHPVVYLHRDRFGPLRLTGVVAGSWRYLEEGEVEALCHAAQDAASERLQASSALGGK